MPLAKCPRCNHTFHVAGADPDSWYARRWPLMHPTDFLPELCWPCRRELLAQKRYQPDETPRKVS